MSDTWYIYMHTCPNGKRYIGQTKQTLNKRWLNGLGYGYDRCPLFCKAIKKYGWENITHEVLDMTNDQRTADTLEQMYIYKYKTRNKQYGYNLTDGGGGTNGYIPSEETREKLRKASTGKKHSPETIAKMVAVHLGSHRTGVALENIRNGAKKRSASLEFREKQRLSHLGKPMKEETKLKISKTTRGIPKSEEAKLKDKEVITLLFGKAVYQLDENDNILNTFPSIREAGRITGVNRKGISKVINGIMTRSGGYKWKQV